MTRWRGRPLGMAISTPGSIRYRDAASDADGTWAYPKDRVDRSYAASLFAELEDLRDAIVDHDRRTGAPAHVRARRMPEGVQFWMHWDDGPAPSSDMGTGFFPHDISYGLRRRGITPIVTISPTSNGHAGTDDPWWTRDSRGRYNGAAHSPTQRHRLPPGLAGVFDSGYLRAWSAAAIDDRNWAQRVLDGGFDAWLDRFSRAAIGYTTISAPSGAPQPDPAGIENDKSDPSGRRGRVRFSDYDDIILRFAHEMNGRLPHSGPWSESPGEHGNTRDGIRETMAAIAYVADRIRNVHGATNVRLHYCPTHTDGQPGPEQDDGSRYMPVKRDAWWSAGMRPLFAFLGLDYYNQRGEAARQLVLGRKGATRPRRGRQFADYEHIWRAWGERSTPMLLGETGVAYRPAGHQDGSASRAWDLDRSDACRDGDDGDDNEPCRARWLEASRRELLRRTKRGPDRAAFRDFRGFIYSGMDITAWLGPEPTGLSGLWALWADSNDGQRKDEDGAQDPAGAPVIEDDAREELAAAARGVWRDRRRSSLAQYAEFWRRARFRGHGGAFFDGL